MQNIHQYLEYLQQINFDIRRRFYESDNSYYHRVLISYYASNVNYKNSQWISLSNWAEICPKGSGNRLPINKNDLLEHECYCLRIKDVCPEDWLIPTELNTEPAHQLPKRATYKPVRDDILLSRFKEPLGKCVIYDGKLKPLYASSNFFLLRAKPNISPLLLLGLLKSSFLANQFHTLIKRRSLIAEMFQNQVDQIMLPNLPPNLQEEVVYMAKRRLDAEEQYRNQKDVGEENREESEEKKGLSIEVMNETDITIDKTIYLFQKNSNHA
jgi:hypothetical protein